MKINGECEANAKDGIKWKVENQGARLQIVERECNRKDKDIPLLVKLVKLLPPLEGLDTYNLVSCVLAIFS